MRDDPGTTGSKGQRKRWLVAADSSRARICALDAYSNIDREIEDFVQTASRLRGADLSSDRQGRSFDSAGEGRHAMEAKQAARVGPVQEFARILAERLERGCRGGEFNELLIAAPPRFLGMIRKELGAETAARVTLEIPKNLVRADSQGLRKAVLSGLAVTGRVRL